MVDLFIDFRAISIETAYFQFTYYYINQVFIQYYL